MWWIIGLLALGAFFSDGNTEAQDPNEDLPETAIVEEINFDEYTEYKATALAKEYLKNPVKAQADHDEELVCIKGEIHEITKEYLTLRIVRKKLWNSTSYLSKGGSTLTPYDFRYYWPQRLDEDIKEFTVGDNVKIYGRICDKNDKIDGYILKIHFISEG